MPTTTPNYGWSVPVSTDLVKDGAVAIETLGDSIDASLVDLRGGTTGQVLAKATDAQMDFSWVTQDDANAIQNAIMDAKGDLIGATAADTPARLAVGANDTVLTADSSTATGLKWAAVPGSSGPAFSVFRNGNQSVTNNVFTKVAFNSEVFDTDNNFDSTTNFRFTPTKAGKYQVSFQVFNGGASVFASIYKNGAEFARTQQSVNSPGSILIDMNGTTDYLEFFGMVTSSSIFESGQLYTYAMAAWIRS